MGMVLITHGSAKRRMIEFARGGRRHGRPGPHSGTDLRHVSAASPAVRGPRRSDMMTAPLSPFHRPGPGPLTVSHGRIVEMVRVAALEVRECSRSAAAGRLAGWPGRRSGPRAAKARRRSASGSLPDRATALRPLAAQVRQAVGATVVRLLGLDLGEVTVVVDGVGGFGQ